MAGIPFVSAFDFEPGRSDRVSGLIRRVVADNPGPFTYTGTGVYIVGVGEVAVIDPGPDTPDHAAALDRALEGERVTDIFVTHHHSDHSPLARPLAERHGATVHGLPVPAPHGDALAAAMEAGEDPGFWPDRTIADGETVSGPGWTIEALHTPGHTSNHVCYALQEENALFSGDHIMGWATSVVIPPDGHMGDYIASLEKVAARGFTTIWPTHGPPVTDPAPFVRAYIDHRLDRERQVLGQVEAGQSRIRAIVETLYTDIDPRLHPAAAMSVLAQMIRLVETGRVACDGRPGLDSDYRPAAQG